MLCVGFDLAAVVKWSGVLEWSGATALISQSNQSLFELSWRGTARVDVLIQQAGVFFIICSV